jgi:hypothetical protein
MLICGFQGSDGSVGWNEVGEIVMAWCRGRPETPCKSAIRPELEPAVAMVISKGMGGGHLGVDLLCGVL